jgi:ABC-type nitrate/sulfonate/bicarbonate transport system substrate-binding protein
LPAKLEAAQPKKLRLAFSALAYANPPFWIAHELKLFEKYGLDSELVYVSGARPIQAMLGGSVDVSQVGGAAAVAAIAQGAEVAILGTVFTRLTFAIHSARKSSKSAISKARRSQRERSAVTVTLPVFCFFRSSAGRRIVTSD